MPGKISFPRTMRNVDARQLSRALDENMRYLETFLNIVFDEDHGALSNVTADQHHVKYSDANAVSAMGAKADSNPLNHDQGVGGGGGAGYIETVVFTADGNFVKADYPWLTHVRVRVQAAGAAGGGTPATSTSEWAAGGGGGGGGYSEVTIAVADLATSETVQVGVKGTGVSGADGNDGEDSLFGTQGKAIGGFGGTVGNVVATNAFTSKSGGLGGSTGTAIGDLTMDGGAGDSGVGWSQYSIGQDGGSGGESIMGGRARGGKQDGGSWGLNYGGGGGGSAIYASQAATAGAQGGDGVVVVELYDKNSGPSGLEEGAWTPTIIGESVDPSVTYTTQAGRYTKLGRQVTVWYTVVLATVSTQGTGAWIVRPLPFEFAADQEDWQAMGSGDYYDGAVNNAGMVRRHSSALDQLSFVYDADGDGDSETLGPNTETLAAGDVFAGFATYLTDD